MLSPIQRVELAINELKQGRMIILTDHESRENEGDIIVPAEMINTQNMNFMIRNGSGIVCVATNAELLNKLNCPQMVASNENTSAKGTPFSISIDAKHGITTGVSAADRVTTVLAMINDQTKPDDLVKPGHIFPLQAKDNGVLEREGHTEGSVDLAKLAGFKPAAVLCELMNPDGTMMRGNELTAFANIHQIIMLSIDDIVAYRLKNEDMIEDQATSELTMEEYGKFTITVFKEKLSGKEHILLHKPPRSKQSPPLVRLHSSCTTGDLFQSNRCDCHQQLHYSLKRISNEGGMLIYLNQEGRGIGLFNKIKTYALQDQGYDTVEANLQLGLPIDSRKYYIAANILNRYNTSSVRLLTNNMTKLQSLQQYGIENIEREAMPVFAHENNHFYLQTKKIKLNHIINLKDAI